MELQRLAYVGSGLLAVVSLLPATTPRSPEPHAAPVQAEQQADAGPDPVLLNVEKQTTRLREYATSAPAPTEAGRNPFRFGEPRRPALERGRSAALHESRTVAAPVEPVAPPPPRLTLVGIAERRVNPSEAGDVERVAIVSGLGDVHLVVAGDRIGGRFTVLAVGNDVVELRDENTANILRLALR